MFMFLVTVLCAVCFVGLAVMLLGLFILPCLPAGLTVGDVVTRGRELLGRRVRFIRRAVVAHR